MVMKLWNRADSHTDYKFIHTLAENYNAQLITKCNTENYQEYPRS